MSKPPTSRVYRTDENSDPAPPSASASPRDEQSASRYTGPSGDEPLATEPFPLDAFPPGPVADMARAICHCARVPDSIAGSCLIGAISASIGTGIQINSVPACVSRANLAIVVSAQSGTGKSVAFNLALAPLQEKQGELTSDWLRDVYPVLRAHKSVLAAESKGLERRAAKAIEPTERESLMAQLAEKQAALVAVEGQQGGPRLYVEDATVQALADVLAYDPCECTASLSADAGEAINVLLGRYNQTKRTDDSLMVSAWTGDPYTVDRKGRCFHLRRPCMAMLWMLQREKLDTLVGNRSLAEGGFVPRLLVCHTDCRPHHIDRSQPEVDADIKSGYRALILTLLERFRTRLLPVTIDPTPQARDLLDLFHNAIADRREGELSDVTSYAARWNEQAWRISLCLHVAEWPTEAENHPLGADTARNAIRITKWFAQQQLAILEQSRAAAKREREEEVRLLLADEPAGITLRKVYRHLRIQPAEAERLLDGMDLEAEEIRPPKGGHKYMLYKRKLR